MQKETGNRRKRFGPFCLSRKQRAFEDSCFLLDSTAEPLTVPGRCGLRTRTASSDRLAGRPRWTPQQGECLRVAGT